MQQLSDNGAHCDSYDAKGEGTQTARTKLAPTNVSTRVRVHKKLPYKTTEKSSDTKYTDRVCDYTNTSKPCPDHQSHEKSQTMPNINTITLNSPAVNHLYHFHDLPVECDKLNSSLTVQTQASILDDFTKEEIVPLYIWNNKNASKDYKASIQQNGVQFGYIPLNDLKIYQGPEVIWKQTPGIIQAHKLIRQSGVPNFLNCRIPVRTQLNPDRWRHYLTDYWDKQLPDLIKYGVPLDFNRQCPHLPLPLTILLHTSMKLMLRITLLKNLNIKHSVPLNVPVPKGSFSLC